MREKKMDRAMVLVPCTGGKTTMVSVQNRHITEVPGPGDEEVVFDTTLDPEVFRDDNVMAAAVLAKLIAKGRHYETVRDSICTTLGELEDLLVDLKDNNVQISGSSRLALHIYALDRIHAIGKMIHFDMDTTHGGHKESNDGNNE